jgi:hypothetical protein
MSWINKRRSKKGKAGRPFEGGTEPAVDGFFFGSFLAAMKNGRF